MTIDKIKYSFEQELTSLGEYHDLNGLYLLKDIKKEDFDRLKDKYSDFGFHFDDSDNLLTIENKRGIK